MDSNGTLSRLYFQRGVTLLEVTIIIGLIAIVSAILLPQFYETYQQYRVQVAAHQIEMNLRFARVAAVKKKIQHQIIFRNTSGSPPNTYTMYMDSDKDSTFESEEVVRNIDTSLPDGLKILTGGISTVTYNARGAATLNGGTMIRISSPKEIYAVHVRPNGSVTAERE